MSKKEHVPFLYDEGSGISHRTDYCYTKKEWTTRTTDWRLNSHLHRLDGPAYVCSDGVKRWFIDGEEVSRTIQSPVAGKAIIVKEGAGLILESLGGCEVIYPILIGNQKILAIDSSKMEV